MRITIQGRESVGLDQIVCGWDVEKWLDSGYNFRRSNIFWQLGHATNMDVKVDFKAFDLSKRDNNLRCLWDIHLDIQTGTCSGQLKQKGSSNLKRKNQKSSSLFFKDGRWSLVYYCAPGSRSKQGER